MMMMMRWLWRCYLILLMLFASVVADLEITEEGGGAEGEAEDQERWHPDKGVLTMKGDPTTAPTDAAAAAFSMSRESTTTSFSMSTPSSESSTATTLPVKDDNDDDNSIANELNDTTTSEEPHSYDENNTVEVSISLALPLAWNLTSTEDEDAVDALVEDVSTAATELFHSTLDHAITMLDGSPQTQLQDDGIAKGAGEHLSSSVAEDKPHSQRIPPPNSNNHTQADTMMDDLDDIIWVPSHGNHSAGFHNGTDLHANLSTAFAAFTEDHPQKEYPKEPPSETLLWDWLGMETLSKEELYKMVLEFLDIEDEEHWHNASAVSPLLRDLKAEIRQAIYGFFFQQQRQVVHTRDPNANHTLSGNTSDADLHEQLPFDNTTDWIPNDPNFFPDLNDDTDHPNFQATGLWEMYLADTRVELVLVQDTYAWWELTMIYPVYVHYQASYNPEVINHSEEYQLDDSVVGSNASTIADNLEAATTAASGGGTGADGGGEQEATETRPYWEPVTDQGTLDFISRLLQRVLEAAVHSGAFLSSLQSLQETQQHLFYDAPVTAAGRESENIVGEILALTIPGMEHPLDELISPYDEMADLDTEEAPRGVATDPPLEPPWGSGTYTYGLLEKPGVDRRQQIGVLLLLITFVATSGMVLLAAWRNVTNQRAMTKAFALGTDEDVAELLQVGWRQYDVPSGSSNADNNTNDDNNKDDTDAQPQVSVAHMVVNVNDDPNAATVQRAEIIEVFDKSREGYYDNDSMLHGSAMQQSNLYDGCSEVPSIPMEYEKHLERHKGRGEKDMFAALDVDDHDSAKG